MKYSIVTVEHGFLCLFDSPSIDKDAMALKVFHQVIIFLFTIVKYTCQRKENSKTAKSLSLSVNECEVSGSLVKHPLGYLVLDLGETWV